MKHRLKRIEQLVRNVTCPGCGRLLTAPAADPGELVGRLDRLGRAERTELLRLLRLTSLPACPNCRRLSYDMTSLTDDQLDALLGLVRKLLGPTPGPLADLLAPDSAANNAPSAAAGAAT